MTRSDEDSPTTAPQGRPPSDPTSLPTRREFLGRLSALGVVAVGPLRAPASIQLPTREVPSTGERLPVVGLGSSKVVLEIPREGAEPVARVIRTLLEHGGKVVDTSPRTEAVEAAFGEVLQTDDLQAHLFLAAKINTEGEAAGIAQMRRMQRLWGRRTMDVVQVESMRDVDVHWANLKAWKDTGEARYIGVTVSSTDAHDSLAAFMGREAPDFVQVNYSIAERGAEDRVLPLARDLGIAVLTNRPFMNGGYFGAVADRPLPRWAAEFDCVSWAQFSVKYVLSHSAVTCALTETTSPEHMAENVEAGIGRLPDEGLRQRMRRVADGIF